MGGGGSTYDYGFRIYNPAIAKFLSVDPLTASYPELTPYQFASNTPIMFIDIDGLEGGLKPKVKPKPQLDNDGECNEKNACDNEPIVHPIDDMVQSVKDLWNNLPNLVGWGIVMEGEKTNQVEASRKAKLGTKILIVDVEAVKLMEKQFKILDKSDKITEKMTDLRKTYGPDKAVEKTIDEGKKEVPGIIAKAIGTTTTASKKDTIKGPTFKDGQGNTGNTQIIRQNGANNDTLYYTP